MTGASSSNVSQWQTPQGRSGPRVNPVATDAWPVLLALLDALGDRSTPCAEDPAPWADVESPQGVQAAEAACLDCPVMHTADLARHRERGRSVWHRPASEAERRLLVASGVAIPSSVPVFTRVDWTRGPDLRLRSWSRAGIVAADPVPVR